MVRIFIFGTIALLYILINYWIGRNVWQLLGRFVPYLSSGAYWGIFWFVALSYLLGRVGERILYIKISRWFIIMGSYWLAAMFYLVIILTLLEVVRLLDKGLKFLPREFFYSFRTAPLVGCAVLLTVGVIVLYGWFNARNPVVQHYRIDIEKSAGELKNLRVVAVSDLHLGIIVHNGRLVRLVDIIQKLQPDIILLPGDIVDEDPGPFIEQDMKNSLGQLKPKYGIYAVPGNHEYIGGQWNKIFKHLEDAGIHVLRDQVVNIGGYFYLAGRDDYARKIFDGVKRKDLKEILSGIDGSLPLILIDHQPNNLKEARGLGVDLQVSGHTHRGQFFPNNLITSRIFEVDWGYLRQGNFQVIVSSGFGTWGPPIRVVSKPEVLDIEIQFKGTAD